MKIIEANWPDPADVPEDVRSVDHREDPDGVLATVDALLTPFGLEVVAFDTGSDQYFFAVRKLAPP